MSTNNISRADNWTETRVSDLKKMWLEGQSASQIARQLGATTRNVVIGKVHRMGLGGRSRPTAPRALIRTSGRRISSSQSNSMARPRPVRPPSLPALPGVVGPELTATATILTLTGDDCRWPIGEPQDADFGYCGRRQGSHASYCDYHAAMAAPQRRQSATGLDRLFKQFAGS